MKQYTIEIVINEGNDEYWEDLISKGNTGCDEILEELRGIFDGSGFEPSVKLIKYTDSE